ALTADPKNVTIRFNMALAYYKGAHYPESAVEFEQVVEAQPDNRNAIVLLADCDLRIGDNKKVLDLLMPIEDKGKGDRLTAYMVGTALINDNRPDDGKRFIDRILRDGESAEAHALLGSAYLHAGDYQSAMEELKRAVDLNPNLEALHSLYGRALLFAGNPDQARVAFQSELKIDPNDFESNLYMGVLLKQDDNYDEALMYLQHAAQVRPGELLAKYYLGCTYLALGNAAKSEELLGQVVKVAPSFVEAHVALATAYYRLKQKDHGDSERAIIQKLNAEKQAKERGASDTLGPGYHGEVPQVKGPPTKPPGNPQQ
ncbi:MAG: tetratricopeptide repeat protein, partial [Blastocatellia bacterium]